MSIGFVCCDYISSVKCVSWVLRTQAAEMSPNEAQVATATVTHLVLNSFLVIEIQKLFTVLQFP